MLFIKDLVLMTSIQIRLSRLAITTVSGRQNMKGLLLMMKAQDTAMLNMLKQ
jgi:hypothetical protein